MISVIMTNYNREKILKEAIDSILNQTYIDFELIIIDDGSTDSSVDIIKSYKDKRIKLFINKKNKGIVYSANMGIDMAMGEYIARMDSDDISLPNRLKKQNNLLKNNPDIDICGSNIINFGDKNFISNKLISNKEIKAGLLFGCPIPNPTIFGRSEVFKKIKYNPEYKSAEDYEFLYRVAINNYKFRNIKEPLLKYRVHENTESGNRINKQENYAKEVQKKMYKKIGIILTEEENNLYSGKEKIKHPIKTFMLLKRTIKESNGYIEKRILKKVIFKYIKSFIKEKIWNSQNVSL
jgi:glycosyltransferase involved in cell wall biosynthesis